MHENLKNKRVLIVDDEPDILETLEELLDTCLIDSAPDYDTARKFLDKNQYDAAILDIMGVRGYDLLKSANARGVPALMLTAHALSPDNLVKSIKGGAYAYLPKDKIGDIPEYLSDVIQAGESGAPKHGNWFKRLAPFFDRKFGPDWKKKDEAFWEDFDKGFRVSKEEVADIL
jgi:DNA-binding NtrC family response regulator